MPLLWPFAPLVPLLHPSPTFLQLNPLDPHRRDFEDVTVFLGETMGDLWTLEKGLAKRNRRKIAISQKTLLHLQTKTRPCQS